MRRRAEAQWWAAASVRRAVRTALATVRQVVGAPDYESYLQNQAQRHPGESPLSPREYYADFITRRFGDGPTRCC